MKQIQGVDLNGCVGSAGVPHCKNKREEYELI